MAALINGNVLTDTQVMRKVIAAVKAWLIVKGYNDVMIHCTRGTYHVTNANNYMMSAKYVLETATGLPFTTLNATMARLDRNALTQF